MNQAEWREYNNSKQKEYRWKKRGGPPRSYTKTEEVLKAAGHCTYCSMLLSSEYHQKHPLRGCIEAMKRL